MPGIVLIFLFAVPPSSAATATDGPEGATIDALMVAYQAGDRIAFEQLYDHLLPPLRRYLRSLTFNMAYADDLLQETFLQIHRSRHTYLSGYSARAWAFGVARNVFLMDRRKRRRRTSMEFETEDGTPPDLPTPSSFRGIANRDQLRRAIADLSPDRREPILLHHIWGFSFREIAGILGIREGAAKVRAHRGMVQLREHLQTDKP